MVYIHVCECMYVCACVCIHVLLHMKTGVRGWCLCPALSCSTLLLWDSLWLNLELTIFWLGWLPSVLLQSSCLCPSQYQRHMWLYLVFMWVLEILAEAGAANSLVPEAFLQPAPQYSKSLRWRQKQKDLSQGWAKGMSEDEECVWLVFAYPTVNLVRL